MTLAEYPEATWYPIPGFGFPQGSHGQNKPRWIILHGTASGDGTAMQQARYFASTTSHGVHFVIGKDGQIVQMIALADAAYGNGIIQSPHDAWWTSAKNPNLETISIEHCKTKPDNSDVLTPAQQDASFKLVAWLCQKLSIPARQADGFGGITGHYSIEGIDRKNCPGNYPWEALWSYLKEGAMAIPDGWKDDGATLIAPNGQQLTGIWRDLVVNFSSKHAGAWFSGNWPLKLAAMDIPGYTNAQVLINSFDAWFISDSVKEPHLVRLGEMYQALKDASPVPGQPVPLVDRLRADLSELLTK
jgi:N-acetyl-anhydromuramyl-L-alanine amidase AmpD